MRKVVSFLALMLFISIAAWSQGKISGTVRDQNGDPVPYATVTVKGTKVSVAADENANFSISAKPGDVLVISAVSIQNTQVTVGSETVINVVATRSTSTINDVVVTTALGVKQQSRKLGYSATTVSSQTINRTASPNALDAIAGKVAGADISPVSGTPGGSTKVVLRGYGVIGNNNQPLYVIDGVPFSDPTFASSDAAAGSPDANAGGFDFGNGLNSLNPNDIESITVLKGTAASSLYGGAAKNGAIMITTKRGRAGKLKVEVNGSYTMSEVGKLPDMQKQFGQGWSGTFYESENGSWGPRLDGKDHLWGAIVDNSQLIKPFTYHSIRDFYDKGAESNNNVSLSGGNDISKFYFSYGNIFSNGVLPSKADYLERHNFSLRTNSTFKNFSLNTSFNYVNRNLNSPPTSSESGVGNSLFEQIIQIPVDIPLTDFRDYKNKFFNVDNYFTPYAENPYYVLYENGGNQKSDRFFGNLDMSYRFTSAISAQFRLGGDFTNARTKLWNAVNAPSPGSYNDGGNVEGQSRQPDVGSYQEIRNFEGLINGDLILRYNHDISEDFNLDALIGGNYYQEQSDGEFSRIENLVIPGFYNLSNSSNLPTAGNALVKRRRIGAYGQAILGYKNMLYLTGNVRNDWSSTLPIENNSIFYPGGNLAWVASNTFNMSNSVVNYLKVRAAYGKTGSDANPYLVYSTLVPGDVGLGFGNITFPFNGVSGFEISNQIGNLNLKPVITTEAELGVEMQFLRGRIALDASVYDKRTKGQILNVPISPSTGYTSLVQNLGTVQNKGIEITFNATPVKSKNFNWNLTYTFTKNVNKVLDLNNQLDKIILNSLSYGEEFDAIPGKPLGTFLSYGPEYTADGKIIVDATGFPVTAADKVEYGSNQRDFTMGLYNTFTYKEFQLGFSFDYRKGGIFYSGTADLLLFTGNSLMTTYNDRRPFIVPNSVVDDGTGKYVENTTPIDESIFDAYFYHTSNKAQSPSYRLLDRSFLKLRDVTLSYTLPKTLAGRIGATDLVLVLYGRNFLLWTPKENIYIDPEASNFGNDITSEFGEFRTGPTLRSYGVSLKVTF